MLLASQGTTLENIICFLVKVKINEFMIFFPNLVFRFSLMGDERKEWGGSWNIITSNQVLWCVVREVSCYKYYKSQDRCCNIIQTYTVNYWNITWWQPIILYYIYHLPHHSMAPVKVKIHLTLFIIALLALIAKIGRRKDGKFCEED